MKGTYWFRDVLSRFPRLYKRMFPSEFILFCFFLRNTLVLKKPILFNRVESFQGHATITFPVNSMTFSMDLMPSTLKLDTIGNIYFRTEAISFDH